MANVFDVAEYILEKTGSISAMKLQKLVYYSQAWSLVWEEQPIFPEAIEAWENGPVVRSLFKAHQGKFHVAKGDFASFQTSEGLTTEQVETIDAVLDLYAKMSGMELSDLTHAEKPWVEARAGLSDADRGAKVITFESMYQFYDALVHGQA